MRPVGQCDVRERVDQTLNEWVGGLAHPLTQVVLTSLRSRSTNRRNVWTRYLKRAFGFFPSLWEGLAEGVKLDAHQPSPQPSRKGRGSKTSTVSRIFT